MDVCACTSDHLATLQRKVYTSLVPRPFFPSKGLGTRLGTCTCIYVLAVAIVEPVA